MSGSGAAVVASFRLHSDAERAAERLRAAGVSNGAIVLRQTTPGLLESLLPEEERSGKTTIEVLGRRSQSIASRVLGEPGAQEVTPSLKQDIAAGSGSIAAGPQPISAPAKSEMVSARAEIEAAATDMNQTIRAIQDRLNPDALKARAKNALKEATVGQVQRKVGDVNYRIAETRQGFMDRIRQNPMPAALTGLGLTWLFMSKRTSRYSAPTYQGSRYGYGAAYDNGLSSPQGRMGQAAGDVAGQVGQTAGDFAGQVGNVTQQVGGAIGDTASQVTGTIGDTASQLGTAVGDTAAHVGDTVGAAGDQVRYTTSQWVSQAGQQAQRIQGGLSRTMDENPLPVGIAVLGLGALVAALMPKTSAEDHILGETHDRLMDKAQEMGQKVGKVAERAGAAAKDEAHSQNLA